MNRLHTPRRFPMTLAALGLLVIPFGCGTETPVAEVPAPPAAVADTQPAEAPGTLDQSIRQTAHELKHDAHKDATDAKEQVREAEGDAKKAVADIEDEAKHKAQAVEADARKAAEDALNNLLPAPK